MTEVWNSHSCRVVQWNGDPQNAPDRCETCDGTCKVFRIRRENLECYNKFGSYLSGKGDWDYAYISTNYVLDDIDCPVCHGYGSVY